MLCVMLVLVLVPLLVGSMLMAVLLVALLVFRFLPKTRRALRMAKAFPQPSSVPVIGHLLHVLKTREELFWVPRSLSKAIGSRYCLTIISKPAINLSDPDAVEAVLSNSKNTKKGMAYSFLKPWLGEGLLTSSGAHWRSRRKLLTPAFHFRILGQFSEHLERQAEALVQELSCQANGEAFDVVAAISRVTLRAICVTAMGHVDFNSADGGGEDAYFRAVQRVGSAIVHRISRPWLWWPLGFSMCRAGRDFHRDLRILHDFTTKVITERKRQLLDQVEETATDCEGAKTRRPFLDVLLSAQSRGEPLSDQDIREEVDTFMFEGHDTTAMALCWALELLGRHPAEQEVLAEEVRAAGSDWESVSKLPYLDRVVKECLRLRPSVPFISRGVSSDVDLKGGQVIPRLAAVNVHIYDLHRHPEHFPDPERFDPDRFLPENEQKRHPFAYIPFSAGPRNCIGKRFAQMEVKLFLSAVVRSYLVRSAMPDIPEVISDLVLRPRDGIRLRMTPRHRHSACAM